MIYILYILFGITLFQDVKYRGVHWSVFLLLLASAAIYGSGLAWRDVGYNLLFLAGLLSALTLYLSLKQGHIIDVTKGYFSWGDILFLIVLALLFEWRMYMLLFVFGTMGVLVIHLLAHLVKPQKTVPYAGYMAAISGIFLAFQVQIESFINSNLWQL